MTHGQNAPATPDFAAPADLLIELADFPGEIRYRLTRQARAPDDLQHVACAIQDALDTIAGDSSEDEFRAAAVLLRAQVDLGLHILTSLVTFAGELEGLGWVSRLRHLSEPSTSER